MDTLDTQLAVYDWVTALDLEVESKGKGVFLIQDGIFTVPQAYSIRYLMRGSQVQARFLFI